MNVSENPSYRWGLLGLFCLCLILIMPAVGVAPLGNIAWAQDEDDDGESSEEESYEEESGGSTTTSSTPAAEAPAYVGPYALVVLCIGLGVFLVCRSANRHGLTKKWKPTGVMDDDEEWEGEEGGPVRRAATNCAEAQSALIYSIFGFLCCGFLAFVALSKASEAKQMIAQHPGMKGEGMATAAQIIAYITLVLWALSVLSNGAILIMSGGGE